MKKQTLFKLITESKPLLKYATPQQKVKLLQLIKEGLQSKPKILKNKDYLEEK